jgi:hypothetical protein
MEISCLWLEWNKKVCESDQNNLSVIECSSCTYMWVSVTVSDTLNKSDFRLISRTNQRKTFFISCTLNHRNVRLTKMTHSYIFPFQILQYFGTSFMHYVQVSYDNKFTVAISTLPKLSVSTGRIAALWTCVCTSSAINLSWPRFGVHFSSNSIIYRHEIDTSQHVSRKTHRLVTSLFTHMITECIFIG